MATLTVYPSPGVTVDGTVYRDGVDQTMGNIRAGAGTGFLDNATDDQFVYMKGSVTAGQFQKLLRAIFLFDTSALTTDATISATTFSLVVDGTTDGMIGSTSANSVMVLVASTPASNTGLANGDYGNLGTTDFGRSATQTNLVADGATYNDISANASGIAAVSKTSITKFGIKYGWDFDNTTTGLTAILNDNVQRVFGEFSDQTGTGRDPKLVVTYTLPSTARAHLTLLGVS